MKKKSIALLLILTLSLSLVLPMPALAVDASGGVGVDAIEDAMAVVTDAIDEMEDIFPDEASCLTMADIFNGFVAATRIASPIFGTINGSVTFLKLIGVMKDPNADKLADIFRQLQIISEEMAVMDEKLNKITTEMAKIQASAEFNTRTEKAMLLQQNWKDFEYRYAENGMDTLIDEYNAMLRSGMKKWCTDVSSRQQTQLVLHYVPTDSGYQLVYETCNAVPADLPADDRYLVLPQECLPGAISWNIDQYHDAIAAVIADNMSQAGSFDCGNFPAFSGEGAPTPEQIAQVAEDAVNVLIYQVTAAEINKDSAFSLQVQRQFANYCSHLLSPEEGLDAICKSFYLTHAFEYQIADEFKTFCNEMALKTGTYGAFAANVLGMSDFVTQREKDTALETYCDTLIAIGEAKTNGLTGNGRYCYLTNTVLGLDEVTFKTHVEVNTRTRGTASAYQTYSSKPITVAYGDGVSEDAALIGDTNALLLNYTLRSNGVSVDFDYLKSKLGTPALTDYGSVVTSLNGEQALPLNSSLQMRTYLVLGSYFKNGASVSLNRLPEDAETDYVVYRRMISGSAMNPTGGTIAVNQVLTGTAIYGESHFYWEDDESAILGGPMSQASYSASVDKKEVDVDILGQHYYVSKYDQSITYNCLVSAPIQQKLQDNGETNPLSAYKALCDSLVVRSQPVSLGGKLASRNSTSETGFSDVSEASWYADCVRWAVENDIASGTDDTHFSPLAPCTRAQAVTFLWRAAGSPVVSTAETFDDVRETAYYAAAVQWAAARGITAGTAENTFSPDEEITREQLAAMLYHYAGQKNGAGKQSAPAFADADAVSAWAEEAVSWCAAQGILQGTDTSHIAPKEIADRAMCIAVLYRWFSK